MTNKEILYSAFIGAHNAIINAISLRDELESIFGEDFPLTQRLYGITEQLDGVSDIHYSISGGGAVELEEFEAWLDDERQLGQCEDCANRTSTDEQGFHRCALTKGDCRMSPGYCCYEWKPAAPAEEE